MDLVQQTAAVRFEWSVDGAGRPAGISARGKAFAALPRGVVADGQVPLDQVDLFPIFVDERLRREHSRRKPQEAGSAAAAAMFLERARQDLLLDARGIAGGRRPTGIHVDAVEFEVGLVHGHRSLSFRRGRQLARFAMSRTKEEEEAARRLFAAGAAGA